jgi:hypothetical protein
MSDHSYTALYYPFIHFKDDRWLKTAALYWDGIGRIVPSTYQTEDSATVRELGSFIEILRPEWVKPEFGQTFIEMVQEQGARLRLRYGIEQRDQWPIVPASQRPPAAGGLSGTDPRLSYIYYEKMTPELRSLLMESGIATPDALDPRWVGMHPKIAQIYMTALADELAGERGMYPLTDETIDHLAVGGWTMERLAQGLLDDLELVGNEPGRREVEGVTAYTAIQTVLPKDLDRLPVERILEFREKYPGERAVFQDYIANFLKPREWLADIQDPTVLDKRLQEEYKRDLKPKLDDFRGKLRDVNIDTVLGVLAVQITLPSFIALGAPLLGIAVNPAAGLLAGAALVAIPVLRDRRKRVGELRSSPVAYLLRIEENLQPRQLTDWILQGVQKFRLGADRRTR